MIEMKRLLAIETEYLLLWEFVEVHSNVPWQCQLGVVRADM